MRKYFCKVKIIYYDDCVFEKSFESESEDIIRDIYLSFLELSSILQFSDFDYIGRGFYISSNARIIKVIL